MFLTNFYSLYQDLVNEDVLLSRWFVQSKTKILVLTSFTSLAISVLYYGF